MTPEVLRRAAAHVVVDDVASPMLDDDDVHHLFRVLRVRDGEVVTVTDGEGRWRECRAVARAVEPIGDVAAVAPSSAPLTIAFAIPKRERPEWIVQKLTELGVDRIVLLHADRSIVRWDDERADKHVARLRRVAREALQQSRRVWLPEVAGPSAAAEFVTSAAVAEPGGREIGPGDRTIAIGPEGGWSPAELDLALDRVSLGDGVLRVETAALVAAVRVAVHTE